MCWTPLRAVNAEWLASMLNRKPDRKAEWIDYAPLRDKLLQFTRRLHMREQALQQPAFGLTIHCDVGVAELLQQTVKSHVPRVMVRLLRVVSEICQQKRCNDTMQISRVQAMANLLEKSAGELRNRRHHVCHTTGLNSKNGDVLDPACLPL